MKRVSLKNYNYYCEYYISRADEDNDDVIESFSLYYIFSVFPSFLYYYLKRADEDNDDVIESFSLYYISSVFPSFVYYYL